MALHKTNYTIYDADFKNGKRRLKKGLRVNIDKTQGDVYDQATRIMQQLNDRERRNPNTQKANNALLKRVQNTVNGLSKMGYGVDRKVGELLQTEDAAEVNPLRVDYGNADTYPLRNNNIHSMMSTASSVK